MIKRIIEGLTVATGKQILGGGAGLFISVAIIGGLFTGHKVAVSKSYNKGADSRQAEVDSLTSSLDKVKGELKTEKTDLATCRLNFRTVNADLSSSKSKLAAQADENKQKLKLQAETFEATQKANRDAMNALAKANEINKVDFSEIFEGMKGLSYVYDPNTETCRVSGGADQLRNAARGKAPR